MDLVELRYFVKVAHTGNLSRAGKDLGVSQPALSRAILRLEEELGQPLLERQTRGVMLTDAGQKLLRRAEQILALVDDTRAELVDDGQTGRLRLGAIPTIAPYLLPEVIRRFRQQAPLAQVLVREETTDKLLHRLKQGEIDLALMAAPISAQYLDVQPLFEEELKLVLPAQHPLSTREPITLSMLEQETFVLLEETHCLTGAIVAFCHQRAFQPLMVEHTSQLMTVQELVGLGHGISFIPYMAYERDHDPQRVYRSVAAPQPKRQVVMVWNPYRFQSRLLVRFRECLLDCTAARRGSQGQSQATEGSTTT
ncbi:MAG: hyalin [Planctomycetaceae bacterium]|nr:MAG: hyalin [Planctomycetaceae bacterium]